jgi:hypothetical protein
MEDRQSARPGRVKLTFDDGTVKYATLERADEPTVVGSPLNKNTLFNSNNSARYGCDLPSQAFEAITHEVVVEVPVSAWSSEQDEEGYFTAQVDIEGMKKEYSPIFSPNIMDAATSADIESDFTSIKRMVTFDGYVVLKSLGVPSRNVSVRVRGV